MGQELQVPDSFKNKQMSQAFAGLNAQDDNLSAGIGQSYPVIAYKGKVWSLRHRGERKTILRPDDGTPSAYLDVIILGQTAQKSKSYYKDFKEGDTARPICASIDGIVPDLDVVAKQAEACALCPHNVWKTDPTTGRKGRDCTDYKRLAVLILPTQTKPILGSPLMEPVFLRVPPDSLNSLAIMGDTMAAQGYHYSSYITRITFDPQKAHPCMIFRPLQGLSDNEAPVILELRADPTVGRITGGDTALPGLQAVSQALSSPGTNATGLVATATPPTDTSQLQPATSQQQPGQTQTAQPATTSSGLVQPLADTGSKPAEGAQLATPTLSTSAAQTSTTGLVDTGFGGANTASGEPNQPQTGLQTAADVGNAEASDDELDARIASLINK